MSYSLLSKCKFYFTYAYFKLIAPLECQNFRLKVLFNEFAFLFYTLGFGKLSSEYKNKILLKTKFGNFNIRDIGIDKNIASPSFERLDIEELMRRMNIALTRNHKVIFIEVGAGFGKYTVAIGTHFKKYRNKLIILSFEPEPESFKLLNENVRLNNLKNVRTFRRALSDKTLMRTFYFYDPMKMIVSFPTDKKIHIRTNSLDSYRKYFGNNNETELFMVIDVEEHEIAVLKGSKKAIKSVKNITLLIEDSAAATSDKLNHYLSQNGKLIAKKTPYNSFWKLKDADDEISSR